jgi:sporulation protein YlmC with PRC-barrel domain
MLQLSIIYYNRKILSLRTGGLIGNALSPVINPNNLKIEGWYAQATGERGAMVVLTSEVRDIIDRGIVVDDHSSITPVEDLVRLKDVIAINFELIGKTVATENKKKLGKVQDYAVDDETMQVKKMYVNQSLLKNFSTQQLIIDRSQIIEINDRAIIVNDTTENQRAPERATAAA